jgi:large subunit ribosomal protein L6
MGKLPIPLPKNVEVKVAAGKLIVKGPKGTLDFKLPESLEIKTENQQVSVILKEGYEKFGNVHGLYRALLSNMVKGTTEGFEKKLEMIGVGYRAAVQGNLLDLQIGFSHPTKIEIPQGIAIKVEKNTLISITGIDCQQVGQFAATVRSKRPPEPYQGKGIRYAGEYVRKKAGKAAASKK